MAQRENLPDTGTEFLLFDAVYETLTEPSSDPGGVHDLFIVVEYPDGVPEGRITLRNFDFAED